jgi:hypothetical protein
MSLPEDRLGGSGGVALTHRCNQENVVQGIWMRSGQFLNLGPFFVAHEFPHRKVRYFRQVIIVRGIDARRILGVPTEDLTVVIFFCPSGIAGKAVRGRHGIYIDSLRFVCDFWDK